MREIREKKGIIKRKRKLDENFVGQEKMYYLCSNMLTPLPVRTARSG